MNGRARVWITNGGRRPAFPRRQVAGDGAMWLGPLVEYHGPRGLQLKRFPWFLNSGQDELQVEECAEGLLVGAPAGPRWLVRRDGSVLPVMPRAAADPAREEALRKGPVEVLARSMRGQFCLHASAVSLRGGRVIAFVGESGVGKSTLARLIHRATNGGWRRVADDVVPAWLEPPGVAVDLSFPQPKLAGEERWGGGGNPQWGRLEAVYRLEPPSARDAVTSRRARPFEAVAIIAGNTMAARLFNHALLEAHLAFSAGVAARLVVGTLQYPREPEVAPRVVARLAADLGTEVPVGDGRDGY